jgi:type VI secretion system protein VasI
MRKLFICLSILGCLSNSSFIFSKQQENNDEFKNDFKKASVITNEEQRLKEYDKIAIKYGFAKKEKSLSSKWIENVSINPLDDSRTVVLMNDESSESLIIRHSLGKLSLFITCRKYLGHNSTEVTYRVGKSEAQTDVWVISSDNKAVFYSGNVEELLQQMIDSDTFVSQITPYGEVPITTVFDIRGLKQLLIKYKDNFGSILEDKKESEDKD